MGYRYYKRKGNGHPFPIKRTDGNRYEFYYEYSKQWIRSSTTKAEELKDKTQYREISELDVMLEML